jgi:hypothetical protein
MRKWFFGLGGFAFILIALQACGPKHKEQPDCGYVQNVYGERISWKGHLPVPLYVHSSVPSQYYGALQSAIQKWESDSGRDLFRIVGYGIQGANEPRQDGVNVIYWMNTWETNKANEQARTSVYWIGDRIHETDIRINAQRLGQGSAGNMGFNFYLSQPAQPTDVHFESLMVHELGHVLGLQHKDAGGSVMNAFLASSTVRPADGRMPETDLGALQCEY